MKARRMMETEPDPPTLALASSLATSTLGGSLSSTLGGATQQERLGLLVGKLGHALREVRLRALRNLRLKLATPELLLPSSPSAATAATGPPPSPQGMLRAFFAVHGPQLYAHLRSALLDEGDKALQGEALMLLAEVCRQPGQHAARRGLVAAGVADALAGAPGFERHEEARALAHDIRQTLLLATSLVEEDGAGGGGHEEEAGADVSMLGASVASGFTLGGRRRRESLPIPPLPTSSSSSSSGGAAADGEQMMPPPTEDEAGASTTRFSLSSSMPAPNDSEPALSRQQQQQQPPQPQQLAHLLLFEGWKFPPAPLGRADERRLFEFQVRFGTRTDAASALALCRRLRTELLEDYPAEVMLQKSAIIRQLLRTVRRILVPDGAGAEEEADNHEDDADTSLSSSAPSTASLPMRATMTRPTDGEDGEQQQQQPQPAVKPEAVVLEALATLDALSRKLGGAIRLHAQPAFKPPVPLTAEGPWSASSSPSSPSSYPAGAAPIGRRSATAVLEGSSTGAVGEEEALALSLSLEGFAFLAIDSLLALLHLPHTAPGAARPASAAAAAAARAIPTRALVVIHTLLPYLSPPAPTSAHGQRLLALLSSLAPALAAPAAGPGAMGDALPLLALRLLELLPAGSELPGLALEIPEPVAALALAAAAHWPARFAPLVRALQGGPGAARAGAEDGEGVMAGIEAARRLVARAKPVLSLLLAATQGEVVPAREEEDRQESYGLLSDTHTTPATWLSTMLRDRIEPALPLLGLTPDGDLVLLALHLAVRALAVSTLGEQDENDRAAAFAAGLRVILALLALPCDDNRLAAHRGLARMLQQRGPVPPSPLLAALAARLPTEAAAALTGPAAPRALARAVLGREEGAALLRHLLVFGVRDPVDTVRAAAWDALGGALGVSGEGEGEAAETEEEEDVLVNRRLPPLLPLLVAARGHADAEEGRGAAGTTAAEAATVPLGIPGPRGLLARFVVQVAKAAAVSDGEEAEEDWALLAPLLDLFSPTPTLRLGARRQLHALLLQRPGGAAAWPKNCTLRPEAAFEWDEEADEGAGGGWAGLRSAAAAAWAGGARYGGAAAAAAEEAAASPARLGALCDLLLDPGALREAGQMAAARDLTLLLTMNMGRPSAAETGAAAGLLPPWASMRVLGVARRLLDGATSALEEAGAELLLVVAWGGSRLGSHDLRPFVPFLFHASPAIRGTVRLAVLPALFGRGDYWAATDSDQPLFSDRAPDEVLARVPSTGEEGHALTYLLSGPPTRDGGGDGRPATTLMLPAFIAGCFRLPTFPGSGGGGARGAAGTAAMTTAAYPRPLVWVHPLPPLDPLRDVMAVTAPLLFPLLDALIPLWYSLSLPEAAAEPHGATGDSPLLSPVPALVLTPQGSRVRAAALAMALREADSHSALSAALQALTQAILAAPAVADAFLGLEWTDALGRLLQAPPATRRDDRLLRDALFLLTHHLVPRFSAAPCSSTRNRDRRTQLLALAAVGMECFVPVLQRRPPQTGRSARVLAATAGGLGGSALGGSLLDPFAPTATAMTAGAARGTRVAAQQLLLEEDLVDDILAFFLALCDAHAGPLGGGGSGSGVAGVAGVLATRCPLVPTVAALLVEPKPTAPPPSPRTTALGLLLLARLLPAAGPRAPALVSPRLLLRLAGREHDPEAFKGSAVARAALRCLRGWLSLPSPLSVAAAEGAADGEEPAASSSSMSLLRFISDKQATVRALAYGCLAQAVLRGDGGLQHGWLLGRAGEEEEEEEGTDEPSLLEMAVQVLLDPREAPAVAAEAAGVVAAVAAVGDGSGGGALPVEAVHVAALLQAAGEALAPGPWAQPARAPAVLGALHAILRRRLFAAPTAVAAAEGLDGTLLLQLMWQQGLPQDLIRLLDSAPALRQLHDAAAYAALNTAAATAARSSAAATLLAAAAAEAPGATQSGSAYFLGRHAQRGEAAAAAALAAGAESWQASVVEESWRAGGGEAVAAAGHAEAMSLLRRLLLKQRRRDEEEEENAAEGGESRVRFELVDEAALAGALVACLEYWSRQDAAAAGGESGEEEEKEDGGWVLISEGTVHPFSPSAQLALTEACALGMEAFPRLPQPRRKADGGTPTVLVSRAADATAAVVARLFAACSTDGADEVGAGEGDMSALRLRRAALGLLSLLLTAPAVRLALPTPLGGRGGLWPLLVARHRALCGPAAFWREQASERALVTSCLTGLLEAGAAGVEPGAAPALVGFVLGRVRAVYEALLVEGAGLPSPSPAAAGKSGSASTGAAKKKAAATAAGGTATAAAAQRRKKSNLLRGLNARLQQQQQQPQQQQQKELPGAITTTSGGGGRPLAWAAAAEEGARLLTLLRALLLAADGTAQEAALQGGLADLARKLWPYTLRLEEGARGHQPDEASASASVSTSASPSSLPLPPTLLEALLGALCNYAAFHEGAKLSLLEQAPGASSLLQRALRLALRDAEGEAATRPAVVELAMALVRSLALTVPGRKQLVQTQALAAPGGCCALPRLLRGAGNRLLRPAEVAADPARRVRLLSVLRLLVSVTLAAEGQRMLVAQCPGLPQLLDELLDFLRQPPAGGGGQGDGGDGDGDGEGEGEGEGEALRTEACAQLCYLLRNLAFLRGQSKAQVCAAPRLLGFLVLDALPHPALAVRFPATVAVWSLLYHSERSLAALLRGTLAPGQVRACLDRAAHRLEVDEEEGEQEGGGEIEARAAMVAGTGRALANIERLLYSSSSKDPPGGGEGQGQGQGAAAVVLASN